MTREEILAMKPGRKLDALVAEVIFKRQFFRAPMIEWQGRYLYKHFWDDPNSHYTDWHRSQEIGKWEYCGPSYSADISAAWEVVGKMKLPFGINKAYEHDFEVGEIGYLVNWCKELHSDDGEQEECCLECSLGNSAWAITAPEAICRAALLAMMDDE